MQLADIECMVNMSFFYIKPVVSDGILEASSAPPSKNSKSPSPPITTCSSIGTGVVVQTSTLSDSSNPNDQTLELSTSSPLDSIFPQTEELPDPRHSPVKQSNLLGEPEHSIATPPSAIESSSLSLSSTPHRKRPSSSALLKFAYKQLKE